MNNEIHVLDDLTINKIAAGEVVERPSNVVKELVENAIDSGADAISVEIKDGGISLIRVTDNGCGIEKSQVRNAFLRHATSKISNISDLTCLDTLGFRGEALASICAVSMTEIITKTENALTAVRYVIEGGKEISLEEIGAPSGTTILVKNLFYNTLPRKKFLKSTQTETSYVSDLMEHLALSHPNISFSFITNNQSKFQTSGNGDLKEIIYRIYGREVTSSISNFSASSDGIIINGFVGDPVINRSNRNFEVFFVNGRYIESKLLSKAVECGYREYLMQHKFPFVVLHFSLDTDKIDVNVHPAKMEIRFDNESWIYDFLAESISDFLRKKELIPDVILSAVPSKKEEIKAERGPEPFEHNRREQLNINSSSEPLMADEIMLDNISKEDYSDVYDEQNSDLLKDYFDKVNLANQNKQMTLFEDEKILSESNRPKFNILGQIFDTYWLIVYEEKLLIIDQHAAHEKVLFERFVKHFETKDNPSQNINPPLVVTVNGKQKSVLANNLSYFEDLGFEIEEFGGNEYIIVSVPLDLYGYTSEELFYQMLDEMDIDYGTSTPDAIRIRIATMACKAAVKGNMNIDRREAEELIDELLSLDNPYHCPHGRPTIVSMSKYELEKKFQRVVN